MDVTERTRSDARPRPLARPPLIALLAVLLLALVAGCAGDVDGAASGGAENAAEDGAAEQAPLIPDDAELGEEGVGEGDDGSRAAEPEGEDAAGEAGSEGEEPAAAGSETDTEDDGAAEQYVVHTAELVVESEDIEGAAQGAKTAVLSVGGYVEAEYYSGAPDETPHASLTLRVPVEEYEDTLDELSGLGDRIRLDRQAEDVTAEVADVESRIESAEASLDRLRDFLDEADSISEMLEIEADISGRQADLEALQARHRALAGQSGMSTIDLTLAAPDSYVAPVEDEEEPLGFVGALRQGWSAFVAVVRGLSVVLGWLLPFLPILVLAAIPVWLLRRQLGERLFSRTGTPPARAEESAQDRERAGK